ncbi:DUF5615 family PIN-like protein [Halobaculum sp. EA56]|uniref:DUF5615 family PIN-like protein n=1 Tax=Halobaculum sp. EA56 TaxID=3421648 RepID=UPI003EBCE797
MSGWRFLLDENIDPKTATYLEKEGIYAEHVRDALWQGADDEADVLPYARDHELIDAGVPGCSRSYHNDRHVSASRFVW